MLLAESTRLLSLRFYNTIRHNHPRDWDNKCLGVDYLTDQIKTIPFVSIDESD